MKKIMIFMLAFFVGSTLCAQNSALVGDVRYTTEIQYDFKERCNWVNLLALNTQLSTEAIGAWRNGFLELELISVYRTAPERILEDWQTFSNIDEASRPLRLFTLGYTHTMGKVDLFFGLRNVNRDYFTAPYTSLFTNSSCGIYPTISANYPLANYPLSAMCLHAQYGINDRWSVKNSLYNGVAYEELEAVFTIDPKRDGLFNMTEVGYTQKSKYHGVYSLGVALHSKMAGVDGPQVDCSFWVNAEQCIYAENGREIGVLAQYAFAPSGIHLCSSYWGVGLLFNGWLTGAKSDQLGIFVNQARFDNQNEVALELTWKHQIIANLEIQPALHLIENSGKLMVAGLFRLSYLFNFK